MSGGENQHFTVLLAHALTASPVNSANGTVFETKTPLLIRVIATRYGRSVRFS